MRDLTPEQFTAVPCPHLRSFLLAQRCLMHSGGLRSNPT